MRDHNLFVRVIIRWELLLGNDESKEVQILLCLSYINVIHIIVRLDALHVASDELNTIYVDLIILVLIESTVDLFD